MIPKDPYILQSYVNTKLRDFYSSLDDFCKSENVEKDYIQKTLKTIGMQYNSQLNRFVDI